MNERWIFRGSLYIMIEKRCKTNFRNWKNNPTVSKLSLISMNWNHKWSNLIFHLVSNFIPFPPHWFQDWMRSWNVSHPVASQTKKVSQRVEFTSLSLSVECIHQQVIYLCRYAASRGKNQRGERNSTFETEV